ncbi:CLUMA_CG003200, isoform A [Clunio marinus]|uniref:CLUMA_CG003200, isoform A n=1 Tax=Clunio marinus TaxID=568069 RepID=A0A1J1HNC9_9DIPT|nr:CLUMA_CG003200, isoform A [Clunio marinus]
MNFKLVTCLHRKKYPKTNVATKKTVKKKSNGKKKRKKSSQNHKHRMKNSYMSSNLFSKNFYPANYFFQDESKLKHFNTRVGVYDRNGLVITRNTPFLVHPRHVLPSSRALSQQYLLKVGLKSLKSLKHLYLI